MRTIKVEYNVYRYDELCEEAKERVKQWFLDDDLRGELFTEDVEESLNYWFPNSDLKVQWSLSSCQGDGVNVYGSLNPFDFLDFVQKGKWKQMNTLTEKEMRTIRAYAKDLDVLLPCNRRYTYCYARFVDADEWIGELYDAYFRCIKEDVIRKFFKLVVDVFEKMCSEYESSGYDYLYEMADEEVREMCEANEYEFYENGEIA